jgi:peroxin-11B
MRDARKLFRLFKSVNEAKKIKDLLGQERNVDNILNIIIRGFFLLYWFFDNLNILSKIKILNEDPKKMAKIGATFWLLALLTNLLLLFKNLASNFEKGGEMKR